MHLNWKKTLLSLTAFSSTLAACSVPVFAATSNQTGKSYVIQRNDTFWTISRAKHLSLSSVLAANLGVNPLNLYPGLTIQLPSQHPAQVAAPVHRDEPTSYVKKLSCVATAYTADPSENGWGAVDYLGNPLKVGTIAVDPSVIPIGSIVLVTGYSFQGLPSGHMICRATDEGSAIRGNRIDMFVPTNPNAASEFGFQNVSVYVLK